jgi:TPR repeat protein
LEQSANAHAEKAVRKTLGFAFLAACAPVLAQTNYGTITFTNKSGDVISNAVVTKAEASKLTYRYSVGVGGGVVPLVDLPEGLRARFGYSPDSADNAAVLQRPAQPTEADRKKFEETKAKAETGDAQAQGDLGHCYYDGEGVIKDVAEAVKWYRKAAEQGNGRGENGLGLCYLKGNGVTKDVVEALKWIRKAAEQGDPRGETSLGFCYENGEGVTKNAVEAVKWYRKAADQGFAGAQCNVGACYHDGSGVTKDEVEAVNWYRKAAEQSNAPAQMNLGMSYHNGDGVTKDAVEAAKWYRKAAEQGFAPAQFNLGNCYHDGDGVTKDVVEAVKWYRKGAEQGDSSAKSLDLTIPSACACRLAFCYYNGDGVTKDVVEAQKWFRKAAAQGFGLAGEAANLIETNRSDQEALGKVLLKAFAETNRSDLEALERMAKKALASSNRPDLETLSLTTKVMEKNDIWWQWSYQLKVRNNTDQPVHEFPHLRFLDAQGFIIYETICELKLSARETKTVLGTTLVELPGAARVKTINVE